MSKRNDTLHQQAEACRLEAQITCDDFNAEAEQKAADEFEKGEVAQYFRDNADYITGLVISRIKAVKEGSPTLAIRPFDADTLVRLLTSVTEVDYDGMGYDDSLSDEATIAAASEDGLTQVGYSSTADTPTTGSQRALRRAILEYARTAAAFAKKIGSSSLLDWAGVVDILQTNRSWYTQRLPEEEALRLVGLLNAAANRLRLDKIIAELPPFKSSRKSKKSN